MSTLNELMEEAGRMRVHYWHKRLYNLQTQMVLRFIKRPN
jgi:hypothetical protein